nr:MAG TPA: hypothetical protein [Caudoviricetes sp.]
MKNYRHKKRGYLTNHQSNIFCHESGKVGI